MNMDCPACKMQIDDGATVCPFCRSQINKTVVKGIGKGKIWAGLYGLFVGGLFGAIGGGIFTDNWKLWAVIIGILFAGLSYAFGLNKTIIEKG